MNFIGLRPNTQIISESIKYLVLLIFLKKFNNLLNFRFLELILMELFFELHDKDGVVHNKFQLEFDNQVHVFL